jgi:hypothetical protein
MKTITAIFLTELRGNLSLIIGLLCLIAVHCFMQTIWITNGNLTIPYAVETLIMLLIGIMIIKSLWRDAPFRRERFLATRPSRLSHTFLGKYAAFVTVVALPLASVEWIKSKYFFFGFSQQLAAASQNFLLFAAIIAALFPCVWWLHNKKSIVLFIVCVALTFAANHYYQGQKPQAWKGSTHLGIPYSHFMLMIFFTCFAVLANLRFVKLVKIPTILSCLLIGLIVTISMIATVKMVTFHNQNKEASRLKIFEFLAERYSANYNHRKYGYIQIAMPNQSQKHHLVSNYIVGICINKKNFTTWYQDRTNIYDSLTATIQERYANANDDRPYETPRMRNMPIAVPWEILQTKTNDIEFELEQSYERWEIALDLPLIAGSHESEGTISCCVSEHFQKARGSNYFNMLNQGLTIAFTQNRPFSRLWTLNDKDQHYRIKIYEPKTGKLYQPSRLITRASTLSNIQHELYSDIKERKYPDVVRFSSDSRILILKLRNEASNYYQWKSNEPVHMELMNDMYYSSTPQENQDSISLTQWLTSNPAPTSSAPVAEREDWVNRVIHYAKTHSRAMDFHHTTAEFKSAHHTHAAIFAKAHAEGRLTEELKDFQFCKSYPKDILKTYPSLAYDKNIIARYRLGNHPQELADAARKMIRLGTGGLYLSVCIAMPEKIGLTDEEWIEYFTLHECAELYEALESKGLIAERYNYISEEFIKRSRRYDLVLARNHPDALPWFRDFALNKSEDHNIYEIHQLILTYFEPSIKPVTKASDFEQYKLDVREWFLAQKIEDFRFDSKKQKYILTPKP